MNFSSYRETFLLRRKERRKENKEKKIEDEIAKKRAREVEGKKIVDYRMGATSKKVAERNCAPR